MLRFNEPKPIKPMAKTKMTVTVGGKTVDMDRLEELAQLQATLLPDNWPIAKRDGVRLFLNLQDMAAHEFKRHLAANFKKIVRAALEQQADGEGAEITVGFKLPMNFSALTVAALGETAMSGSQKFGTKGKAKTHDLNQGDFLEDLDEVLDTESLTAPKEEDAPDAPGDSPAPPEDPTPGEEQGHKGKKRGKKAKTE